MNAARVQITARKNAASADPDRRVGRSATVSAVTRRRRARLALAACVLWFCGLELLPNLHLAFHDRLSDHVHTADGIVFTVTYGEVPHVHADGTIHRPGKGRPNPDGVRRVHDDGGLAHHAAWLVPAAPQTTQPLPVDRRPMIAVVDAAPALRSLDPLAATARGPPSVIAAIT